MLDPSSLAKIADWLAEDDFYDKRHRFLFRAIAAMVAAGTPCDPVTLSDWLDGNSLTELVGATYPLELANSTPSAANITAYAEIVQTKSRLRKLIAAGDKISQEAWKPGAEAGLIISHAMRDLGSIEAAKMAGGLLPTKPLLKAWFNEMHCLYEGDNRVTGLPTPWHDINEATRGLQDGELIILAGRPNMGKSVAGMNLGAFNALRGNRTAVFTLEMTSKQVINRCVSSLGRIPYDWIRAPHNCDDSELYWPRVTSSTTDLLAAPLLIDDQPAITIEQLRARCLREHMREPIRLVLVDHLHIMGRPGENEVREFGRISSGLKALAKELKCPVVALAQLNRSVEGRTEKRPTMSDLRASGEIEQDADLVLLLYRDDYYNASTHLKGVVEMAIGKGRDVKTGQVVNLRNRFDEMRLEDWEGALPQQDHGDSGSAGRSRYFAKPRAGHIGEAA